jgi:outer membrane protein TolC
MKLKASIAVLSLLAALAVASAATKLDLAAYLKLVEARNKDLEIGRGEIAQTEATKKQALAGLLPSLGLQANYTRNLKDYEEPVASYAANIGSSSPYFPLVSTEQIVNYKNEIDLAAGASLSIFDAGATARYRQAGAGLEARKTGYAYQRKAVLNAAKKLYYQTLLAEEVVKVKESSERIAREAYDSAEAKYRAGLSTDLDALMAEVAWKGKAPESAEARRNASTALLNFKALAGIPADEEVELSESLEAYPQRPPRVGIEEALAGRPDYALLLQQEKLDRIGLDVARAGYFPTLTGILSVANQRFFDSDNEGIIDFNMTEVQLGLKVALPVYTGGYRAAKVEEERLGVEIGGTQLAKKEEDVRTELSSIDLRLDEASQRVESTKDVVASAQRAYDRASGAFKNGAATQLQLNQATLGLEGSRLQYLAAVYDYLAACFDWELAAGR